MAKLVISFLFLSVCAYCSASFQFSTLDTDNVSNNTKDNPMATILFQNLINLISEQLQALTRAFNLKLRVIRLLASLYTNENLLLARDLITHGIKLANFTLGVLPQSVDDPSYSWILPLIQIFNESKGTGGIGLDLSADSEAANDIDTLTEDSSEYPTTTNPPIFYNAPVNRETRNVVEGKLLVNESEPHVVKDKASNLHEDVLRQHRERLLALEKLINSRRK